MGAVLEPAAEYLPGHADGAGRLGCPGTAVDGTQDGRAPTPAAEHDDSPTPANAPPAASPPSPVYNEPAAARPTAADALNRSGTCSNEGAV